MMYRGTAAKHLMKYKQLLIAERQRRANSHEKIKYIGYFQVLCLSSLHITSKLLTTSLVFLPDKIVSFELWNSKLAWKFSSESYFEQEISICMIQYFQLNNTILSKNYMANYEKNYISGGFKTYWLWLFCFSFYHQIKPKYLSIFFLK